MPKFYLRQGFFYHLMPEKESKILIKQKNVLLCHRQLSLKTKQVERMEEKQIEKGHKL
jgi:hypothetical protein